MKYELLIKEKFWKNLYNSLDKSKKKSVYAVHDF